MKPIKVKLNGIEQVIETCPISQICHKECNGWGRQHFETCDYFNYEIGKPKVIVYVVDKVVRSRRC